MSINVYYGNSAEGRQHNEILTLLVTDGSRYLGSSSIAIIRSAFSVRILCSRSRM